MAKTASDALIERLIEWGVDVIFGLPGDGINGVMEALRTHQEKIRFVQVRHEEAAAFMACGYAKYSGKLGVCLATSGPGAIHLLNGLYDAKMDRAPVLAITGQTYHDLLGSFYQQEVDLLSLFKDVATFNQQVMGASHVTSLVDQACRTSLAYKTVSHITIPVDFQEEKLKSAEPSKNMVVGHTSIIAMRAVVPLEEDLRHAAEVINQGSRAVILAGQGALGAADEIEQLADLLAAPIVKPLLGKACVPVPDAYPVEVAVAAFALAQEDLERPLVVAAEKPAHVIAVQVPFFEERPESVIGTMEIACGLHREHLPPTPEHADADVCILAKLYHRVEATDLRETGFAERDVRSAEGRIERLPRMLGDVAEWPPSQPKYDHAIRPLQQN